MVDVGVLVEGEPGSADAEPAEAAGCQSDREDAVRLGSGRLAGAGDDGGPDPVALGVVGVFEEEAFELAWPHVCGR
ncbi:hypothetical protein [Actinoplanes utahensis]|uniref:Uncharacterized protein n=1 Tax=Actinoplanes utahensis TaxID=1869 RepID=A0A0A6UNU6_ACTUT|nr:hypothetical protein [Actinoplanes utahensis]KHD75999.1 hypothetical protein MB27_19090 [Actinoplanes utahensis]GIF35517.1 hypothetical protein Aut01nite_85030 [Actinoplanes utahensis]